MGSLPLFPVRTGDPIPNGRGVWNALLQAGRAGLGRTETPPDRPAAGGQGDTLRVPSVQVLVRNDTDTDLPSFAVLKVGDPLVSAVDRPNDVRRAPVFGGTLPDGAGNAFVVTIEPAAVGATVRAVALGLVPVDLVVNDEGDGWAAPSATAGTGALESTSAGGPAKVWWKDAAPDGSGSGPDTRRAVVLLQGDMGAGDGSGSGECLTYFSIYMHQQLSSVSEGQTVGPRQQIGEIGPYDGDLAHLHISIGDGIPLQAPNGFPIAGTSIDIASWPGLPIVGEHVGEPPTDLPRFTPEQVEQIQAHFGLPVEEGLDWSIGIGSEHHTLWDFYAIDFVLLADPDSAIGMPVYAAFVGDDVKTTCVFSRNLGGNYQWVTILKHELGDCGGAGGGCTPAKYECANGYLQEYTCDTNGNWVWVRDTGVACNTRRTPPPGSGSGPGSGAKSPTNFDAVSRVCVKRGGIVVITEDTTLDGTESVVHVDASEGAVTVTLLDPAEVPSPPAPVTVKRIDDSGNTVTINSAGGQVEFGSSLTLTGQGDWKPLYTDGTDWFVGVAPAVAGIVVESHHVQVKAQGYVSAGVCQVDPEQCCEERAGSECCPFGEGRDELNGTADGPLGLAGAQVEFIMTLYRDGASWSGSGWVGFVTAGGQPGDSVMSGTLYCTTDEDGATLWQLEGELTRGDGTSASYRIDLTPEGDHLEGVILFPGDNEPVPVTIEYPCPEGSGDESCECPEGTVGGVSLAFTASGPVGNGSPPAESSFSGSFTVSDKPGIYILTAPVAGSNGGTFFAELRCRDGGWRLVGYVELGDGPFSVQYDVGMIPTGPKLRGTVDTGNGPFKVEVDFPCSPPAGVTTTCCPEGLPETLTATFSGVFECCYVDGSEVTLTYDPVNQWWASGAFGSAGCLGTSSRLYLYCCTSVRNVREPAPCGTPGESISDWKLHVVCGDVMSGDLYHGPTEDSSCSGPTNLVFVVNAPDVAGCCSVSSLLTVTVTG